MAPYSRHDVILVLYPFTDLTGGKVRPAIVVSAPHPSRDLIIVPLTSRVTGLVAGEFVLQEWGTAGLNVASALKRGLYTIQDSLVRKRVGQLSDADRRATDHALCTWLDLPTAGSSD